MKHLPLARKIITLVLFAAAIPSVISCSNTPRAGNDRLAAPENTKWKMGVALYSFNMHTFDKALQLAESSGVKYVEGFTFHEVGPLFGDSTMGKVDDEGIALMNKLLLERGLSMSSMYVDGAKDAKGWQRFFEIAHSEMCSCSTIFDHNKLCAR